MDQNVIAIICDCDGTLCPDTTTKLVRDLGIDPTDFWENQVNPMVEDGWDPPLAYLERLMQVPGLTKSALRKTGDGVEFFPGALDFVFRIREGLSANTEYRQAGITLEWYIVSSGIEEVLGATPLEGTAKDIFACAFDYNDKDEAVAVKRGVTFTEKTKFIYAINKGISGEELRKNPYSVNNAMAQEDRRIPFEHMVYVGDGPTDIPCFSMIGHLGGLGIGVMPPNEKSLRKPYELAEGNRLTVGPYTADYQGGTDLFKMMSIMVTRIADSILVKRAQRIKSSPSH